MLSREALETAITLTDVLDAHKLRLVPETGTPLEAMVRATRSDANFNVPMEQGYQPDVDAIEYIANAKDPILGFSPHDQTTQEITDLATKAVSEHLVFAKNVVAPAVQELVESTMQSLQEMTASSLLGMEVVVWSPPAPFENPAMSTMVRKFEELSFDIPMLNMRMPGQTGAELLTLLETGSKSLDEDIASWADAKGESFFINLWECVFQQRQAGLNEAAPISFRDFTEDRENGWDNALAIYLWARKLADNPLPGTEMDLKSYEQLAVDFRNQAAARVCRALDELDLIGRSQVLVRSMTDRVTTVYNTVYRKWIEAGGDNEVLFGNLLEMPAVTTVPQLTEKAERLKGLWQRHAALTATVESNRKFGRTKDLLVRHFDTQMRRVVEGEESTLANRDRVMEKFREQLDMVRADELDNLWSVCLKLVCRSRFYRTEAERILAGIERIKREHPECDVREAAAVSMIEYVAFWVSSQFKVVGA